MDPTVYVAGIGVVGVTVAGWFSVRAAREAARASNRSESFLHSNVGTSNGEGTVVEMLTNVLSAQRLHEAKDTARFGAVFTEMGIPDPLREIK